MSPMFYVALWHWGSAQGKRLGNGAEGGCKEAEKPGVIRLGRRAAGKSRT